MYNPVIIENEGRYERSYDLYSRLLRDRIIFLGSEIDDRVANSIVAQMLFLEAEDPKKDITFYINSPGGAVTDGFAIYDTMQYIKPDISTICVGQAASFAAVLLAAGKKGKRFSLEHARIMIHQPHGGARGQASDIHIHAQEILKMRELIDGVLAKHTGQDRAKISQDSERDKFMSAEEALNYGLVDDIIRSK